MGMKTVRAVNKVRRARGDLKPGQICEMPSDEAAVYIRYGDVEEHVVERQPKVERAEARPQAEQAVTRQARRKSGKRDSGSETG